MRVRNDEAISVAEADYLGFTDVADRVAHLIDTCEPPFTLALHGDWGSGKTSLLKLIKNTRVEGSNRPVTPVFFEAWRHQFEPQPVIALLHTIRDHFSFERSIWEEAGKKLKVGTYAGLRLLADFTTGIAGLGTIPKGSVETWREESERAATANFSVALTSSTFRVVFESAIESLHGDDPEARVVILVDDLDRCNDASVVRFLEAIKLYLSAKNCIFVIAADRQQIIRAVANTLFVGAPQPEQRAHEYCGKLFQASIDVPHLDAPNGYAERLLKDGGITEDEQAFLDLLARTPFLLPNPRSIKRYLAELALRRRATPTADLSLLCALQYVQTFHPGLYRTIESNPTVFLDVQMWCAHEQLTEEAGKALQGLTLPENSLSDLVPRVYDRADGSVFRGAGLFRALGTVDLEDIRAALRGRE